MPSRSSGEDLAEELSRRGLRVTRQRVAALRLLRKLREHPTVVEIHHRLLRRHPRLSQKTVYEILAALEAAGLVSRVGDAGGPLRFEAHSEPHYHAYCRICGRLYDLAANTDSQIRRRAALPQGFCVERVHVTLHGRCTRCRDQL